MVLSNFKGGPLLSVFENLIKTSHVNIVYHLTTSVGPQLTFQSAIWSRLGSLLLGPVNRARKSTPFVPLHADIPGTL
jgi:hypothetical protein